MNDDTDFSLEIAPITRVMAIKAKGFVNYGPQCIFFLLSQSRPNCDTAAISS